MKLKLHYCNGEDYSSDFIEAEFKHRLLTLPNFEKIEVTYSFDPQTKGYSDDKLNVEFINTDDSITPINKRKYFALLTFWQKQKISWNYDNHYLQKDTGYGNMKWILGYIIGFASGYLLFHLTK